MQKDSIIFIFKGGLALKTLYTKYSQEMPGIVGDILNETFFSFFKKSDADFEILIDPKLENFENIYLEITDLSYLNNIIP